MKLWEKLMKYLHKILRNINPPQIKFEDRSPILGIITILRMVIIEFDNATSEEQF